MQRAALSLKLKITLFSLGLFVCAIWGLAYHTAASLRPRMQELLAKEQFAAVSYVADYIDDAIRLRTESLVMIGASLKPGMLADPETLRAFLAERRAIYQLFPLGLIAISIDGKGVADYPTVAGRGNADFSHLDFFTEAVRTGKPYIGKPRIGRFVKEPRLIISAPIFDSSGRVVGVLAGVISLSDNSLFKNVAQPGSAGGYLVISPRDNLFVSASDNSRIMEPLPPPGRNLMHDRYMRGFEGSGVANNSRGVEELTSAHRIPSAGWFVVNTLPTKAAFAPIEEMQRHIYRDAMAVSLLVALLVWLFVRRELAPLSRSAASLHDLTLKSGAPVSLSVEGAFEIRQLLQSFNSLQSRIEQNESELRASELVYRSMFEANSAVQLLIDPESGEINDANPAAAQFYGWSISDLKRMNIVDINVLPPSQVKERMAAAVAERKMFRFEHRLATGQVRSVEVHTGRIDHHGRILLHSIVIDVTEREQALAREHNRSRVLEMLARGQPLREILLEIVRLVESEQEGLLCSVLLLDKSGRHLLSGAAPSLPDSFNAAIDGLEIGPGAGCCGNAAFTGLRTVAEDLRQHPDWANYRQLVEEAGLSACWSEPLKSSKGQVLGTLAIYRREPGLPGETLPDLIERAADLASIAVERKRDEEGLQLAATVFQSSLEAILITDSENRIQSVNPAFTEITGYQESEVLGRDPKLLASGQPDPALIERMWSALNHEGYWQGEIWNRRKNGEFFAEWLTINALKDESGRAQHYVGMFSDITEKKRTEELIWWHANYDALTGLPNRRLFRDRLEQELKKAEREQASLALLFIDLDHFKEVNDTLGHDAGDLLLQEATRRITACVRESDTVARLGGDEFTVVLPNLADYARIERIAAALIDALIQPFDLNGTPVYVSASIGITLYPSDALDIESLLKNADQAMYVAKEKGRNRFSYFTQSMQQQAQTRRILGNDLRGALAAGQFEVYYQPIVDFATDRIVKAEALLRWHHPERGLVSPAVFIPLAEELGLINDIGDWVLRQAAHKAKQWCESKNSALASIQISVNKSPRQFFTGRSEEALIGWLNEIDLPASYIVIEITEGLLMDDRPEVTEKLYQLRKAGVQISLDDFGTGYSAMSYLQKFDIDYLKIDQSFVRDMVRNPGDQAIAEAIIVMAHKLGIKVIAEGVETREQRDMLAAAGCDFGQGYLFAKPMRADELDSLLIGS